MALQPPGGWGCGGGLERRKAVGVPSKDVRAAQVDEGGDRAARAVHGVDGGRDDARAAGLPIEEPLQAEQGPQQHGERPQQPQQ
eukprot:CAMPEP_0168427366 /NCGR_PEP_ID=MMETSP0228-20121227/36312_1 /TAXON_ID=133427 /ORGANISM="Protoceratium reticulatum, Strain CCCM 535 (=CCMP 1889)" /LENGTH=83 /DNA_ID=CAMNT_0008441407 /DNA_START=253 /DNA_END=501 /DNA_ORIENTATION=+